MRVRLLPALVLALAAAGCSKGVVPVTGKLSLGSVPAGDVMVSLCPVDPESGCKVAHGGTDPEGKFVLYTLPDEGVMPGEYKIKLQPPAVGPSARLVPKRFTDVTTTPWRVTVPASGGLELHLDLGKNEVQ